MKSQHAFSFQAVIWHFFTFASQTVAGLCSPLHSFSRSLRSAALNENKGQLYINGHSSFWHSILFPVDAGLHRDATVLSYQGFALPGGFKFEPPPPPHPPPPPAKASRGVGAPAIKRHSLLPTLLLFAIPCRPVRVSARSSVSTFKGLFAIKKASEMEERVTAVQSCGGCIVALQPIDVRFHTHTHAH